MASPSRSSDPKVCVGAIAGAFGVRGEVRLRPFTEDPGAIASYGALSTEDGGRQFEVKLTRPVKGGYAAKLTSVATREQAEALKGVRLYAPRTALPDLPEDEYYHADLIGMKVVGLDGAEYGRVKALQNYGAGDFLEVAGPGRKSPALLPFTREGAPHVDLKAREIVVDPPVGVFEDDDEGEEERP
ncbi:MAG: ribosome maturation factor RimM [Rhodobacteraceae bacterium]|nr:ribosome maturation factor RimM [Paracoccaceae bacterium]